MTTQSIWMVMIDMVEFLLGFLHSTGGYIFSSLNEMFIITLFLKLFHLKIADMACTKQDIIFLCDISHQTIICYSDMNLLFLCTTFGFAPETCKALSWQQGNSITLHKMKSSQFQSIENSRCVFCLGIKIKIDNFLNEIMCTALMIDWNYNN